MTDTPTAEPTKRELVAALIEQGDVLIHLDPRRTDVVLPEHLRKTPTVALSLGLSTPVPIPDLDLGEDAITATLSFSRTPHRCVLPWTAIYLITSGHGRAYLWAQDAPPEALAELLALALAEREAAAAAPPAAAPSSVAPTRRRSRAKPRPRPRLEAVPGGRSDGSSPQGDASAPSPRPALHLVR
jgi:hypothetical protein